MAHPRFVLQRERERERYLEGGEREEREKEKTGIFRLLVSGGYFWLLCEEKIFSVLLPALPFLSIVI